MKQIYKIIIPLFIMAAMLGSIMIQGCLAARRMNQLNNDSRLFDCTKNESVEIIEQECELLKYDPTQAWIEGRYGCYLPNGTRSISVEIKSEDKYAYSIVGYGDPAHINQVSDTNWQRGDQIFELDPELYYVFVGSVIEGGATTDEDIENNKVIAFGYFRDFVYQSSMMPPKYYFEDNYLQDKVKTIRDLLEKSALYGDSFMFITDDHWRINAKNSPSLANYIKETTGVNKIFSGGDRTNDGYNIEVSSLYRKALGNDNYFPVVGNHEFGEYLDEKSIYASSYMHLAENPNVVWGKEGKLYYYVNNPLQKIRYVVLQAFESNPQKEGLNVIIKYDEEQIEWFKKEALNVDEGWTILVLSHVVVYGGDYSKEFIFPTEYPGYEAIHDAIADYEGKGEIAGILQGHSHWDDSMYVDRRQRIALTRGTPNDEARTDSMYCSIPAGANEIYISAPTKDSLSWRVVGYSMQSGDQVYCSETSKNTAMKFRLEDPSLKYAVIFTSDDGSEISDTDIAENKVSQIVGAIPLVQTTCDKYVADYPAAFEQSDRVYGTITEQAFDVVILDKAEKKLSFVRIGAPAETDEGFVEIREFHYGKFNIS